MSSTDIHPVGTLVADPELRFTPNGVAVANFRIACNERRKNEQTGQWEDGDATFLTCNAWRDMAENITENLTKGMRVLVSGRLKQRSYETKEGEKRTVYEVEVEDVGASLKWKPKDSKPAARNGGGFYAGQEPPF
jgi:single-strand DNA-binding protein